MKVLHIIARFNVGGTATWISNLSTSLKNEGHESYVLAGNVQSGEDEDLRFHDIGGIRLPALGRRIALLSDVKALMATRRVIKEIEPDIINTHTAKAGVIGRLAAFSLGRNRPAIVHTIHGHLFRGYFGSIGTWIVGVVERLLSRITDVMLFAGERVKSDCISRGINHQKNTFVVMPGVNIEIPVKREHTNITVGWLARFALVKRPERVVEIAREIPDVQFLIGGDGPLRTQIEKEAPRNCVFLGWVSPEKFWSQIDIALLTSDNEALPISLIEAQLSGLPCVSTPAGSAPEVVLNGVNGFVSENFDSIELAKLIKVLVSNSDLRTRMGEEARQRSQALFSLKRQLNDHIKAYEQAKRIRIEARNA